jgi:hypothetical protein
MMSGGTFLLLKAGYSGPESSKQAEIRLANLLKILRNFGSAGQYPSPMRETTCDGCFSALSVGYS